MRRCRFRRVWPLLLAAACLACGQAEKAPLKAPVGDQQTSLKVGTRSVLESVGPQKPWGAVFEDDGQTAWFYALDHSRPARSRIVDAVHIYNVADVADRQATYPTAIRWSKDGQKVGLFIEGYPRAVFDFAQHRGYARSFSPRLLSVHSDWSPGGHEWSDSALVGF